MTDRYQEIRDALAMGPTPGPWEYDENAYGACPLVYGANETPVLKFDQGCPYGYDPSWDVRGVDAAYIAACDPDTVRSLLAERDALLTENALRGEALETIRCLTAMNQATNPNPFALTALLGDIHQIADAALGQEADRE